MRNFLLLSICLLWSIQGPAQKWVEVTSSDTSTIEIDLASIKKDGDLIYIWGKRTYTDPQERIDYINWRIGGLKDDTTITLGVLKKWENYDCTLYYKVYDVKSQKSMLLHTIDYSKDGSSLYSLELKYTEYSRLIPGTIGMGVLEAITDMVVYEVDGHRASVYTYSVGELLKQYPKAKLIGFKSEL